METFAPIQPLNFKSVDGTPLKGYWMPSETPSDTTLVVGHGFSMDFRSMVQISDILRDNGYNLFLFDFRAHGQSKGKMCSFGFHEGKDIAGAVSYVDEFYPLQSKPCHRQSIAP